MIIDWFLLLAPILLLPILLLLSFTGCTVGESSYPELTFILRASSLVPAPPVTKVRFEWIDILGHPDVVNVEKPEVIIGDSGELIHEFRYRPEMTEAGQVTAVSCLAFSDSFAFDEAHCGPFELVWTGKYSVKFEIISDAQGKASVQVSEGGCPILS